MLEIVSLQKTREGLKAAKDVLAARPVSEPLFSEFLQRLEAGSSLLDGLLSQGVTEVSPLHNEHMRAYMRSQMHFGRCSALLPALNAGNPYPLQASRHWQLRQNRHVLRWSLSRLSWLRSKLLGYADHYCAPPLRETLLLSLFGSEVFLRTRERLKAWRTR